MGLIPLALTFLKANWKWIVPVVAALGLLAYIKILHMEINHYKAEAATAKAAIAANGELEEQLNQAFNEMSKKYHDSLKNQFALQDSQGQAVRERIAKNEASKHVPLDADLIGLFNGLKPTPGPVATAKPGDDGKAAAAQEAVKTLNDLLVVSAENDENHLKCIATVEQWQTFWKEFEMTYKARVSNDQH